MSQVFGQQLRTELAELREMVDEYVTEERILKYVEALAQTPGPSTTASFTRGQVVKNY